MKAAIQGERGSFSHQAALQALGAEVEILPRPSFDALFAAASQGEADRAVVPIENSLHGSIHENYDRLRSSSLHIVGETQLRIRQCLIGRPGAPLASIRRVAPHPVALAQCRRFFAERPQLEPVAAYDTAGSVQDLLREGPDTHAAITSRLAAELLVLAREPGPLAAAAKTSVVFVLDNVPGALHRALGVFASRSVDLAKIESRPLPGHPWEYAFYLDVLGDPRGAAGEAIAELEAMARELRVLGSYPPALG